MNVKGALLLTSALVPAFLLGSCFAVAAPQGPTITSGQATVTQNGNRLDIRQTTDKVIIDWRSFSIAPGEIVQFYQLGAQSIALNRVTGSDISFLNGSLFANGSVFLVNPNGIVVGRNATINVGSFLATTSGINNSDFLAGRYLFTSAPDGSSVSNLGNITAADGGYVVLSAAKVDNQGTIVARKGTVALGAAKGFTVDPYGDGLLVYQVGDATAEALVTNSGSVSASGGRVQFSARSVDTVAREVINTTGLVEANSVSVQNGEVIFDGGTQGIVSVGGQVQAAGLNPGETGGTVKVLGNAVGVMDGAKVDASGQAGGGTVLVGGNWHGAGTEPNASVTYVAPTARITADSTGFGIGGQVVLWSDVSTRDYGTINVKGGSQGGDGGSVEVSSHGTLDFQGTVDRSSPLGKAGSLLLDPLNITIQSGSTTNVTGDGSTASPFAPSTTGSFLMPSTITNALATGDVTISTVGTTGGVNGDIIVNSPISTSVPYYANGYGVGRTLTMSAAGDINVNSAIGLSGGGYVKLNAGGNVSVAAGLSAYVVSLSAATGKVDLTAGGASISTTGSASYPGGSSQNGTSYFSTLIKSDTQILLGSSITGGLRLESYTPGRPITLGTPTGNPSKLEISLGTTTAPPVVIGDSNSGNVLINSNINRAGSLIINSGGTITNEASITVTGYSSQISMNAVGILNGDSTAGGQLHAQQINLNAGTGTLDLSSPYGSTIVAGSSAYPNGSISFTADAIAWGGSIDVGSSGGGNGGTFTVSNYTSGRPINIGTITGAANTLEISWAEIASIQNLHALILGDFNKTGDITINSSISGLPTSVTSLIFYSNIGHIRLNNIITNPNRSLVINGLDVDSDNIRSVSYLSIYTQNDLVINNSIVSNSDISLYGNNVRINSDITSQQGNINIQAQANLTLNAHIYGSSNLYFQAGWGGVAGDIVYQSGAIVPTGPYANIYLDSWNKIGTPSNPVFIDTSQVVTGYFNSLYINDSRVGNSQQTGAYVTTRGGGDMMLSAYTYNNDIVVNTDSHLFLYFVEAAEGNIHLTAQTLDTTPPGQSYPNSGAINGKNIYLTAPRIDLSEISSYDYYDPLTNQPVSITTTSIVTNQLLCTGCASQNLWGKNVVISPMTTGTSVLLGATDSSSRLQIPQSVINDIGATNITLALQNAGAVTQAAPLIPGGGQTINIQLPAPPPTVTPAVTTVLSQIQASTASTSSASSPSSLAAIQFNAVVNAPASSAPTISPAAAQTFANTASILDNPSAPPPPVAAPAANSNQPAANSGGESSSSTTTTNAGGQPAAGASTEQSASSSTGTTSSGGEQHGGTTAVASEPSPPTAKEPPNKPVVVQLIPGLLKQVVPQPIEAQQGVPGINNRYSVMGNKALW